MKGTLSPWILEPTSLLKICQLLFIRLIVTAYDIQLGDDTADDNYLIIGWDSITVCVIIICLLLKGHSAQANNDSLRGKTLTLLDTPFHHPYGYETISLPRGNDTFPFENVQLAVFSLKRTKTQFSSRWWRKLHNADTQFSIGKVPISFDYMRNKNFTNWVKNRNLIVFVIFSSNSRSFLNDLIE